MATVKSMMTILNLGGSAMKMRRNLVKRRMTTRTKRTPKVTLILRRMERAVVVDD